jgi:putative ABC transport system substrate-binding protein
MNPNLKAVVTFIALGVLAPAASTAEAPTSIPRVGVGSVAAARGTTVWEGFEQGLRELGYVDGQNIVIEARWAERRPERLPALAAELVRLKVDIIVTTGDAEIRAAKQATGTIPIVMVVSGDPVRSGYVAGLARPGGNVTGMSFLSPELSSKLLELLKETLPAASRVAVLWNAANPVKELDFQEARRGAAALGLTLQSAEVRATTDFDRAFVAMTRERPDALLTLVDEFVNQHHKPIGDFVPMRRLPSIAGDRRHADAGGLMSYGPSVRDLGRRAAAFVERILKGAKPADFPVEQPTKFEFVINMRTAKVLNLTIPPSLLARADQVIE